MEAEREDLTAQLDELTAQVADMGAHSTNSQMSLLEATSLRERTEAALKAKVEEVRELQSELNVAQREACATKAELERVGGLLSQAEEAHRKAQAELATLHKTLKMALERAATSQTEYEAGKDLLDAKCLELEHLQVGLVY